MPDTTTAPLRAVSAVVLAAAIAACGGPAAPGQTAESAGTAETPAPSASASSSEGAHSSPILEATPAPSVVVPSLGAATPLVDMLPAELAGAPTQKFAFIGSDLSAIDPSAVMIFDGVMQALGADGADMTIGTATNAKATIIAIRVAGKSAEEIGDALIASRTLNATTTKDEVDLGGKHVVRVSTTIAPLPFYVYGTSDVSFTIAGADESIVAEALSKLP
jgi:hypothetical protein